jgi:hypothetical protein
MFVLLDMLAVLALVDLFDVDMFSFDRLDLGDCAFGGLGGLLAFDVLSFGALSFGAFVGS